MASYCIRSSSAQRQAFTSGRDDCTRGRLVQRVLDGVTSLSDDPHRRRRGWIEWRSIGTAEHTFDRESDVFEPSAQFFDSVQALASFVLAVPPTSADTDSLRHSRRIERQRVRNRDHDAVAFLSVRVAERVEHRPAVHNFHRQASIGRQHPSGLPQDGFVLVFGVEEAERIHHDRTGGTFGSKWQTSHVTASPTDPNAKFLRELSRSIQQGDGIEANDLGSMFGKSDRMAPMAATDIKDARHGRQLEQVPKPLGLLPHMI
jgi:hypothetical protein